MTPVTMAGYQSLAYAAKADLVLAGVITSYSIHYTKLYEPRSCA